MCVKCGQFYCGCGSSDDGIKDWNNIGGIKSNSLEGHMIYPQEFLLGMIDGKQLVIESQIEEIKELKANKELDIKYVNKLRARVESLKTAFNILVETNFNLADKIRKQDEEIKMYRNKILMSSNQIWQKTNQGRSENGVIIGFEIPVEPINYNGYKPMEMVDEKPEEEVRPNSIPKTKIFMEALGFKMDKSGCWRKEIK
jgi:hypothetical protein